MKRVIAGIGIIITFAFSNAGMQSIDKMVSQIKKPRKGVELKELATTPDPFVTVSQKVNVAEIVKPKKRKRNLTLSGIVNDKAYINGAWYKEGDQVAGYTLKYVGTRGVVLMDEKHIKRLFLHKRREDIIIMKDGK